MTNPDASIATVQESPAEIEEWWGATDADEVEGFDLLKDAALFQLVGIPFMAVKAVFRDGIQRKGNDYRDDYVSLELRVAPDTVIMRDLVRINTRRTSMGLTADTGAALPDEQLVINDGSTGLYRQVVQYLDAKGLIGLPEGATEGEKGDTIYDLPRSQWLAGAEAATEGIEIKLRCSRGLRFSEYTNTFTGDEKARTWYIA